MTADYFTKKFSRHFVAKSLLIFLYRTPGLLAGSAVALGPEGPNGPRFLHHSKLIYTSRYWGSGGSPVELEVFDSPNKQYVLSPSFQSFKVLKFEI